MPKQIVAALIFLMIVEDIRAQVKQTEQVEQVWLGYFNQTRLSKKWGVWVDVNVRTKDDFVQQLSLAMIRPGITYYLNDQTKLSVGYAYINLYPGDNHRNISRPEHRPWQQIQWHTNFPKLKLMQWMRLEERFRRKVKNNDELADGNNFNWRARYNILAQFPLSKKKFEPGTFSFVMSNEVFVNFGKEVVYNYFDQNRFFAGFHYHINKTDNLQFGYLNVFQQLSAGNRYRSVDAFRLFYFHNLDLRAKK
jgi:Protein of unknown function (DUF2490)